MNKVLSIFIILLQCVSLYPGGQKVWGTPKEQFSQMIKMGTHPVFREQNTNAFPLRELEKIGSGAGFFLSFHQYRDQRFVYRLLEYEIEHGSKTTAVFSARRLMDVLIRDNLDSEAENIGHKLLRQFPGDYLIHKAVVEARYWQEKDISTDVSDLLLQFPGEASVDSEIALFNAVNSLRLNKPGWRDQTAALLFNYPAGDVHTRYNSYLRINSLVYSHSEVQRRILLAKTRVARGRGASALEQLLLTPPEVLTPALIKDLSNAVHASGQYSKGIAFLNDVMLAGNLDFSADLLFEMNKSAGFFARRSGRTSLAYRYFLQAYEYAGHDSKQRMLWYVLDSLAVIDYSLAVDEYLKFDDEIDDKDYFSDFFSRMIYRLFSEEDYRGIEELFQVLSGSENHRVLSQLGYILYRLDFYNLYSSGISSDVLKRMITHQAGDPYYAGLIAHFSNSPPPEPYVYTDCLPARENLIDTEFVRGFFAFGLDDQAYEYLLPYKKDLSPGALAALGKGLADAHRYWESIRTAQWGCIGDLQDTAELLYPRGFYEEAVQASKKNGHPDWLLFALMRAESYFNPNAGSHAGAVGLTQLLPDTAADVAMRIGLSQYDLTNPGDNITLGSWYISHMLSRADSPPEGIMAYNAGLTRVREWRRNMPHLPPDLFIEAVPYTETRNYIKKIIRYSLAYVEIYKTAEASDVYKFFF